MTNNESPVEKDYDFEFADESYGFGESTVSGHSGFDFTSTSDYNITSLTYTTI